MKSNSLHFFDDSERLKLQAFTTRIDKALATQYPPQDVRQLVPRDRYADALKALRSIFGLPTNGSPAEVLHVGSAVAPWRMAHVFRVTQQHNWVEPFTMDTLHGIARHTRDGADPETRRRARMALACFGKCDWPVESLNVRAAYLYGEIVRSRAP